MVLHGILVFNSIHYYSMVFNGITGYYIVFDDIQLHSMVLQSITWYSMALHGIQLYCWLLFNGKNDPDWTIGSEVAFFDQFHHTKHVSMSEIGPADSVGEKNDPDRTVGSEVRTFDQVVTMWSPSGHRVVTEWSPCGHQVVSWSRIFLVFNGIQWFSMVFRWSRMVSVGLGWS